MFLLLWSMLHCSSVMGASNELKVRRRYTRPLSKNCTEVVKYDNNSAARNKKNLKSSHNNHVILRFPTKEIFSKQFWYSVSPEVDAIADIFTRCRTKRNGTLSDDNTHCLKPRVWYITMRYNHDGYKVIKPTNRRTVAYDVTAPYAVDTRLTPMITSRTATHDNNIIRFAAHRTSMWNDGISAVKSCRGQTQ